jgi:glycosyltransferase involved in cell wall biosynthesis
MRIAFDYQTFVLQSYGGISRYFTQLAQGLLDMEQEVEIFAPMHRNSYLSTLPQGIVNGRHINRYPPKTTRLFSAYNQLGSRFQIARWKPDLVHETYYARAGSAPRICPTVITVYDMIHELFANEFPKRDNTAAIKRIAVERADHVICISENTKLDLMRLLGTPANKISVVLLGFDQFAPREEAPQVVTPTGNPFLLYVGQRGGYKNFSGFLKAVASSKRLLSDFDIIAFGGPRFSSAEFGLISSLGFAENQVQHRSGSDNLLGSFYSSAKAFVYPSLYEGFGIPPLEAMAHNCPVISSNTSSMPEVIGVAGEYFDPNDTDDMRRAIETVVCSDNYAESLQKAGADRLTAFSWGKCTQETFDIYRSLT